LKLRHSFCYLFSNAERVFIHETLPGNTISVKLSFPGQTFLRKGSPMPQTVVIGLLVIGAVLLLIAITGGQFKIFVAEVDTPVSSKSIRLTAGLLGLIFIVGALVLNKVTPPPHEHHSRDNAGRDNGDGSAASSTPAGGALQTASVATPGLASVPAGSSGANPAISNYAYALVFDPPTNIRMGPATSSAVECSVTSKTSVKILGTEGNWYRTDICGSGQVGYIYKGQVKF